MRCLILALTVFGMACSKPNPNACCTTSDQCLQYGFSGITPCDSDHVCNMDGNCVAPMCKMDSDCNDPALVCDTYGDCVPAGTQSQFTLTVQIAGSGSGTIASTPAGLTCSSGTCTGIFDVGTQVQLAQTAATGSFLGWAYGCRGTDTCSVTMSADQKVGAMFGVAGDGLWTKQVAAAGKDSVGGIASTGDGDLVVAGTFAGSLTLDTVALSSGNDSTSNTFVAKLDGWTGKTLWAKSFAMTGATQVAVGPDGQIYVYGEFTGNNDLGGGHVLTNAGGIDVFVLKLSSTGDLVWSFNFGGSDDDHAYRLAVGSSLAFIVTSNSSNGALVAINADAGTTKYAKGLPQGNLFGIALDATDVSVTGTFASAFNFGAGSLTPVGLTDASSLGSHSLPAL